MSDAAGSDVLGEHLAWLADLGRSPQTIRGREGTIRSLAAWLQGHGQPLLLAANRADLLAWRRSLTVSPNSVVVYASHVRCFYAWCLDEGLITASPAARIPVPRMTRGSPRPIAERDVLVILAAAPPRVRPWLVLENWCGLRAAEVAGLRCEDICLTAAQPYLRVTGKGSRERVVPLSPFAAAELAALGLPARGWAFPRRDGRPGPVPAATVSKLSARAIRAAGVDATAHRGRHRAATAAWRGTRDLLAVKRLLGHKSVASTEVYTLADDEAVAAAVNSIPAPARLRIVS